jgi:redox-sensitive bicupin YhaK (pirin superfamily)
MSWLATEEPQPGDSRGCAAIDLVIVPRAHDLGGFEVRRALPSARRQMSVPCIFWDQMGPAEFRLGQGMDVCPHPHIGLATVTYLFRGEIIHGDSLGTVMPIRPGALNVMTAGRGIVHAERTGAEARKAGVKLFGIQAWMALPRSHEESAPDFVHYAEADLPVIEGDGARLRLIAGEALGNRSPVALPMATIYADAELAAGASLPFDPDYEERAIYTVEGEIEITGDRFGPGQLLVFRPGDRITVRARARPLRTATAWPCSSRTGRSLSRYSSTSASSAAAIMHRAPSRASSSRLWLTSGAVPSASFVISSSMAYPFSGESRSWD